MCVNISNGLARLVFDEVGPFISSVSKFKHKHMVSLRFQEEKDACIVTIKTNRDELALNLLFSFVCLFGYQKRG